MGRLDLKNEAKDLGIWEQNEVHDCKKKKEKTRRKYISRRRNKGIKNFK